MCGLIAWIGSPPDREELTAAVARRGPHSHGWWTPSFRHVGRGPLANPPAGDLVLGHSRLATSGHGAGTLPPTSECQPIIRGQRVIAHNGVIDSASRELDSLQLLDQERPHRFLELHGGRHALIVVEYDRLSASSTGQPLFSRSTPEALVISSVPTAQRGWRRIEDEGMWHTGEWLRPKEAA